MVPRRPFKGPLSSAGERPNPVRRRTGQVGRRRSVMHLACTALFPTFDEVRGVSQGRAFRGSCTSQTKADKHFDVPPLPNTRDHSRRGATIRAQRNKYSWISRSVAVAKICLGVRSSCQNPECELESGIFLRVQAGPPVADRQRVGTSQLFPFAWRSSRRFPHSHNRSAMRCPRFSAPYPASLWP
jgi:hypothetical protein